MIHISPSEWGFQRKHLINYAAERPDVRFVTVGFIFPDLGRSIVRRARLRVVQAILVGNFADIHVTEHCLVEVCTFLTVSVVDTTCCLAVSEHKDVCRLDISMHHT